MLNLKTILDVSAAAETWRRVWGVGNFFRHTKDF